MTSVQKNPKLMEAHPVTLMGAIIQCAQLGLEPDDGTGKAYLIPFWNSKKGRSEVQFMPGYRGLIHLARNSGDIKKVVARIVKKNDEFRYQFGINEELHHVPSESPDRMKEPTTHVYAIAWFKDSDEPQWDVMNISEVEEVRKRAPSYDKKTGKSNGPWDTDYDEMCKKTAVRRLSKMLPSSTERPQLALAATLDEKAERGIPQDLGVLIDPLEVGTPQGPDAPQLPEAPRRASDVAAAPPAKPLITVEQRKAILDMCKAQKIELPDLIAYLERTFSVNGTENLPAEDYSEVIAWITSDKSIDFGKK